MKRWIFCVIILLCLLSPAWEQSFRRPEASEQNYSEPVDFWITSYLEWHDSQRYNRSARRLIFRENGDGFGDRVKALVAAYGYAVLTKRLLIIRWNSPYPLANILSNRSRERFIFRNDIDSDGLAAGYGRDYKFRYFRDMPISVVKLLADDVHTVTLKIGPPTQTPDMLSQELRGRRFSQQSIPKYTPALWKLAVRHLLERSLEIQEEVSEFRRQHAICGYGEECLNNQTRYIAIHARIGHGVGEGSWRFDRFRGRERDVATCFAKAVQKYSSSIDVPVFVATDTPIFKNVFIEVMSKVMPQSRVLHLSNKPVHFRKIKREGIFRNQFVEMALLGDSVRTIALRSGYSKTAFWMGQGEYYTQLRTEDCIEQTPVEMKMPDGFLDYERRR